MRSARTQITLGVDFAHTIRNKAQSGENVDFSAITDFEWDKMAIILPYLDPWWVLAHEGVAPVRLNTNIRNSDIHNLIIFMNNHQVVAYMDISRVLFDFHLSHFSDHIFTRETAIFVPSIEEQNVMNIENWIVLRPKYE